MEYGARVADGFRGKAGVMDEREMRLTDLKQQVTSGDYRIEPYAVADAIIRRLCESPSREPTPGRRRQSECSNPVGDGSPSASRKTTSGEPSTTRPTTVKPDARLGIPSIAPAWMQAQSS